MLGTGDLPPRMPQLGGLGEFAPATPGASLRPHSGGSAARVSPRNSAAAGGRSPSHAQSASPAPGKHRGMGLASSNFHHVQFDATRGNTERDRLRNKLVDVGQRFIGFDKAVEDDTVKRRTTEMNRIGACQEGLSKLEKAMNVEIKRRVDANKQVQMLTDRLANEMLERMQTSFLVRVDKLQASVQALTTRGTALEKGMAQFRGQLPSKLQVDTAALVKEIQTARKALDMDQKQRIERDTGLLRRLAEIEQQGVTAFEAAEQQLRKDEDDVVEETAGIARAEDGSDDHTEKFRTFILQEIAGMKSSLAVATEVREQTDDEIVLALSHYTNALQKGLRSANVR